jgi:hypothetical protein
MDYETSGRKRPWPALQYYPGICSEGMKRKHTEHVRTVGIQAELRILKLPNLKHRG